MNLPTSIAVLPSVSQLDDYFYHFFKTKKMFQIQFYLNLTGKQIKKQNRQVLYKAVYLTLYKSVIWREEEERK